MKRKKPLPEVATGGGCPRVNLALKLANEGLTNDEIAEKMGISRDSVNVYLWMARHGTILFYTKMKEHGERRKAEKKLKASLSDEELSYLTKHGAMDGYWMS